MWGGVPCQFSMDQAYFKGYKSFKKIWELKYKSKIPMFGDVTIAPSIIEHPANSELLYDIKCYLQSQIHSSVGNRFAADLHRTVTWNMTIAFYPVIWFQGCQVRMFQQLEILRWHLMISQGGLNASLLPQTQHVQDWTFYFPPKPSPPLCILLLFHDNKISVYPASTTSSTINPLLIPCTWMVAKWCCFSIQNFARNQPFLSALPPSKKKKHNKLWFTAWSSLALTTAIPLAHVSLLTSIQHTAAKVSHLAHWIEYITLILKFLQKVMTPRLGTTVLKQQLHWLRDKHITSF